MNVYKDTCLHSKYSDIKNFLHAYTNKWKLVSASQQDIPLYLSSFPVTIFHYLLPPVFFFHFFSLSLCVCVYLSLSFSSVVFSSSSFVVIHRLTSSFPVERVCSRCSSLSSRSLFAAVVFILSTVCHSICWQIHLFRVSHKRTMMSYFVSVQRARLIELNLERSTSLFVTSMLFRASHPLLPPRSKRELFTFDIINCVSFQHHHISINFLTILPSHTFISFYILQIFLNIIYFIPFLYYHVTSRAQQHIYDFIQINALCRNKISILCNTNIQRANLTGSPSKYYGVSQETEGAAYIFQWLSSDYDLCECGGNTICGYGYNVCRSLRKRERIDHDYPTTDSGNSRHAEATHFTPTQEANWINNPTALSTCESTRSLFLTCDLKEFSFQIFIFSASCKRSLWWFKEYVST